MTYEFGKTIYDPSDSKCVQMLGKIVAASNVGYIIDKTPQFCSLGVLMEINVNAVERPFVVKFSDDKVASYTFIKEILKKD